MTKPIVVDCTELFQNPVRTGIQRVVRELLRNWPNEGPYMHVARFVAGVGLVPISASAIRLLKDSSPATRAASHRDLVAQLKASEAEATESLPDEGLIFIPEVFYDRARSAFYQDLVCGGRPVAILCYDFLPFLAPWLFNLRTVTPFMEYFRAVRAIPYIGHISEATQRDFEARIMRGCVATQGTVLPLGADGLQIERQSWRADRHGFVAIGSLDGRKNQHLIAAAFIALWKDGHTFDLTIVGTTFDGLDCDWLVEALQFPHFRWVPTASDDTIAELLRHCIATIYVSSAEGYGLPPVESLAAGVPVIAPAHMPSLSALEPLGQIRLAAVDAPGIASAVLEFQHPDTAARLWAEAARLRLQSWRDFAAATAHWLGCCNGLPA